jgi:hypothetical protein
MKPERDKIIEQLHTAFPNKPINADGAFSEWGTTYPDAAPYMQQIEGKGWDQLDGAYIARRSDALGFLGTHHLVAVLPVYLRSLIDEGVWSPAAGMLTLILTKPALGKDTGLGSKRFDALVDALTATQRIAVACVLRAFSEMDPEGSLGLAARDAHDGHWKVYLPAAA